MTGIRSGKAAPAVMERSIFRPVRLAGAAGTEAGFGYDGWILPAEDAGRWYGSAAVSVLGGEMSLSPENLLYTIQNNLAVCGAKWKQLAVCLTWPAAGIERDLSDTIRQISSFCAERDVQVCGGDTQISLDIDRPVLMLTGYGQAVDWPVNDGQAVEGEAGLSPAGRHIIMAGCTGEAGTAILSNACKEELCLHFPERLVSMAAKARHDISPAAFLAFEQGAALLHDVSHGGVFGALWELGERSGCGFDVVLKKLPIRQETIEICEYLDLNPYQLYGQGAVLIVSPSDVPEHTRRLCEKLRETGYPAEVIGVCTDGKARRIINGEEIRYLEKPAQDMLEVLRNRRPAKNTGHAL